MNAIPQKAHSYERLNIPNTPPKERANSYAKIEYLDEARARKRAMQQHVGYYGVPAHKQREQYMQRLRYERQKEAYMARQVEEYYTPRPKPAKQAYAYMGERKRPAGRKLTAAYEVGVRQSSPREQFFRGYERYPSKSQARQIAAQPRKAPQKKNQEIIGYDGMVANNSRVQQRAGAKHEAMYKAPKRKTIVMTIGVILAVFAILAGVLLMYANLSGISYKNAKIENEIAELNQKVDKAKMEIDLNEDLGSIRQRAATELGMAPPTDEQIVFVQLEEDLPAQAQDSVTVPEETTAKEDGGIFDGIANWFADLFS